MSAQTDTATDSEFAREIKNAFAALDASDVSRDSLKTALDGVMSSKYNAELEAYETNLAEAEAADDPIAIKTHKAALQAARDELGGMFAAGYSRLNRALDAVENGTITYQFDDDTLVMVSHKEDRENSRYEFTPTDAGHSHCECPDKVENDTFPVCKHEMAWMIYQIMMGEMVAQCDPAFDGQRATAADPEPEADADDAPLAKH